MPYPYRPEDTAEDRLKYQADNPGGDMEEMQLILNSQAVTAGNKSAEAAIRNYNNAVCQFWDNGGPGNTYGYKLPAPPRTLQLEQYYKPAQNATDTYHAGPPPQWVPGDTTLSVQPWTLPEGTVLYTVDAD
jgi:hypothetical protein